MEIYCSKCNAFPQLYIGFFLAEVFRRMETRKVDYLVHS